MIIQIFYGYLRLEAKKKMVLKSAILFRKYLIFGFQNHQKHSSPMCLACGCNVSLTGLTAEAFYRIV